MRPTTLHLGKVLKWTIAVYNSSQALVDADSSPSVAVRKNGASTADSVTVTKRASTTGLYDCSYDPSGEAEGDFYAFEESAVVGGTTYKNLPWTVAVVALERGTDSANTVAPDNATITAISGRIPAALVGGRMAANAEVVAAVTLATSQPNYAPSKAGDAMTLTAAYDAAKTAAPTAADIAAVILVTPANKLTTNASGHVTLTDASLTAAKFAAGAITSTVLASNAIGASQIAAAALNGKGDWLLASSYTAAPTAAANAAAVRVNLATELSYLDVSIASRLPTASYTAPDNSTITANATALVEVLSDLEDLLLVADKIDSTMVLDGAVYQFTANALELGPSGGGGGGSGDATEDNQVLILAALETVMAKTNLITTEALTFTGPVSAAGQIDGPLIIGDDYLAANGKALTWTVPLPAGCTIGTATCQLGFYHANKGSLTVQGTMTDAGSGNATLSYDITRTSNRTLSQGPYIWNAQITSDDGNEITQVRNADDHYRVEWVEKAVRA